MKIDEILLESDSNEFNTKEAAKEYIKKKRNSDDYIVLQHKETGKFHVYGHMAYSQWREPQKQEFRHVG